MASMKYRAFKKTCCEIGDYSIIKTLALQALGPASYCSSHIYTQPASCTSRQVLATVYASKQGGRMLISQ